MSNKKTKSRFDYVKLSAAASGRGLIATARDMKETRDKFGVNFREYYELLEKLETCRQIWTVSITGEENACYQSDGKHPGRGRLRL